jgi:predicted nucleotidyltransferase component of viral defense system
MLEKDRHQLVLKQLLRGIFSDNELSAQLVFKGGTALMLFFGLNRFSTDLDFDMRETVTDIDFKRLNEVAASQLSIRDFAIKENTYLLEGSYEYGAQQVKIEVSRRSFPQAVTLHNFLGLSIPILSNDYLLAHKLCAISSRRTLQNRDIYDADFMLKKSWERNAEIVKLRTGLDLPDYYGTLLKMVDDPATSKNIMLGLGEVLDQEERTWARFNLIKSFKEQLLLRI